MPAIVIPKQIPARRRPIVISGHFQLASWPDTAMKAGIDRLHRWATIVAVVAPLAGIVILAAAALAPAHAGTTLVTATGVRSAPSGLARTAADQAGPSGLMNRYWPSTRAQ